MKRRNEGEEPETLPAVRDGLAVHAGGIPGEIILLPVRGKPTGRSGVTHGFHCRDAIEIPTSLNCSVCPLYHVKKRDRRHELACRHGRKGKICPILTERQLGWVAELVVEVREVTGEDPKASDRMRIEQVVRHRSRLFQVENYLKVAGYLDLREGVIRNVGERLTTLENALARSLGEFRQSITERRVTRPTAPTLSEYLEVKGEEEHGADD